MENRCNAWVLLGVSAGLALVAGFVVALAPDDGAWLIPTTLGGVVVPQLALLNNRRSRCGCRLRRNRSDTRRESA
ncbi:MAG: hypothetical protein KDA21_02620 [Phycisphaerales bacterium]|nr:hypothetical protein [Phycisphaerales bacterium]